MKKHKLGLGLIASFIVFPLIVSAISIGNGSLLIIRGGASGSNKEVMLNETNKPTTSTDYVEYVRNDIGEYLQFNYTKVKGNDEGHCSLDAGGTITKEFASYGLKAITSNFTGSLLLETGAEVDDYDLSYTLESGVRAAVYGNYFRITAQEETDISNILFEYSCTTPVAPHEHDLIIHAEKAATSTEPGNLAYAECSEPGCHKYYLLDCDKKQFECEKDAWVIHEPTLSIYSRTSKYKPSTFAVDRVNNTATINATSKTSAGSIFLLNDEQKTSNAFIETTVKVTGDDQWSDYGIMITSNEASTSAAALLRVTFYAPAADSMVSAIRVRNSADTVVATFNLPSKIDLSTNPAKLGVYRNGGTIIVYYNDTCLGQTSNLTGWDTASDKSVPVNYGIVAQNAYNAVFSNINIKLGKDLVALTKENFCNYNAVNVISNDKISWSAKGGAETYFYADDDEKTSNTYVEATFSANVNSADQYADLGFIIAKPSSTKAVSNLVLATTMYMHNPSKLTGEKVNSFKVKSYNTSNSKVEDALETLRSVTPIVDFANGNTAKFAMYRNGGVIKVYLNDQLVLDYDVSSAVNTMNAKELANGGEFRYGIWRSNVTSGTVTNARILTGTAADNAILGKASALALKKNVSVGNSYTTENTPDTGIIATAAGKKIYLSTVQTSQNVYFETNLKVTTYGAWGMAGIIIEKGASGKDNEPFQVAASNQTNAATGNTNRLKTRVYDPTAANKYTDKNLYWPTPVAGTVIKLAIYKKGAEIVVWYKDNQYNTTFDVAADSTSLDASTAYYYGLYSDNKDSNVEFSDFKMVVGDAADSMRAQMGK